MNAHLQAPIFSTSVVETRLDHLVRIGVASPVLLQGAFPFVGHGFFEPRELDPSLQYTVPDGHTAEVVYFRAGNMSDDLLYLTVWAGGGAIRYFPIGPKANFHVQLAITEPHSAGTQLSVRLAAPRGLSGSVVVDVGIVTIRVDG